MNDTVWVYDLEVLRNFFSSTFLNPVTQESKVFIIHHTLDQRNELLSFLTDKSQVRGLIGFNNVNYDYPVLHYLLTYKNIKNVDIDKLVNDIFIRGQEIIKSEYSAINKPLIPQLDLYRIKHFDNDAKRTSLKWLEFAMNWENCQDMPIRYDENVNTPDEIKMILDYNMNDVLATAEFLKHCKPDIDLRRELTKTFNIDLMNANDPKIGSETFALFLSKDMDISISELKQMRTKREQICFKDCIFSYVKFETEAFSALLDWLKYQCIKETKGAFTDIPLERVNSIRNYVNQDTINVKKNVLTNLNVVYNNFQYDLGTGGIHGSQSSQIFESVNNQLIIDLDVASYYPNLSIQNGLRPEHLGESFTKIYNQIYEERKTIPKSNPLNGSYKLMLNGSYGKSNEDTSFFYDPLFTMSITINGQLLLMMLSEKLTISIKDLEVLQINTDGITIKVHEIYYDKVKEICRWWMELTKLELEEVHYSKMIVRDVNNYIAISTTGKVKLKGVFDIDKDWHKNHSMKIVPYALKEYYINNVPVEETIKNCNDIFKFCKGFKSKGQNTLELWSYDEYGKTIKEPLQKMNRYYVSSTSDKILMKIMPPRDKLTHTEKYKKNVNSNQIDIFDFIDDVKVDIERESNIEAGYKVTIFNKYVKKDMTEYEINYDYYINECYKIINVIKT